MNVLLDLDGTLTDSREGIVACIKYALNELEQICPNDAELSRYIGPPLQDSFRALMNSSDPARTATAVALYRERYSVTGIFENTMYPGIGTALTDLQESGAVLYVATSKPVVFATRIVEHFGLGRFFHGVYGSELDGTRVHKADLIAHILQSESLSPGSTCMVGDRMHDIIGAKANGVRSVGVLWGYGSRAELVAAGATALCESPAALGSILSDRLSLRRTATGRAH